MHTLLQANGTPGLQMLESNVMVGAAGWGGGPQARRRGPWVGPRGGFILTPELTCPAELEDREQPIQGAIVKKKNSFMETQLKHAPLIAQDVGPFDSVSGLVGL